MYYIHFLFFIYSFVCIFIATVLSIFCGASHPEVQFKIVSFNWFSHKHLSR